MIAAAKKKLRAMGYCRVSTAMQAEEGTSLTEQEKAIRGEAENRKYDLVEVYRDEGFSGATMDRPALLKMIAAAEAHEFDILIFKDLSRLGRNAGDILQMVKRLETDGISFVCIDDPALSTIGKTGKLLLTVLAGIHEFQREVIRESCMSGIMAKWKSGENPIGELPFAYMRAGEKDKRPVINKAQAKVYHKIVAYYLNDRMSMKQIQFELNKAKVPPPSSYKKGKNGKPGKRGSGKWPGVTISEMLRNEAYTGESLRAKKQGGILMKFPPLIDKKQWQRIQDRIAQQKRKPKKSYAEYKESFLFDGHLFCGLCGSRVRKRAQNKDGVERLYYLCSNHQAGKKQNELMGRKYCEMPALHSDRVDHELFLEIADRLVRPSKYAKDWLKGADSSGLEAERKRLEEEDKKLLRQIDRGFEMIAAEDDLTLKKSHEKRQEATKTSWKATRAELEKIKAEIELASGKTASFEELRQALQRAAGPSFEIKGSLTDLLFSLPFKERRRIVDAMLEPEKGGRVTIDYTSASDFLSTEDLEGISPLEAVEPLKLLRRSLNASFNINPDKIGRLIASLDKKGIKFIEHGHSPMKCRGRRAFPRR